MGIGEYKNRVKCRKPRKKDKNVGKCRERPKKKLMNNFRNSDMWRSGGGGT